MRASGMRLNGASNDRSPLPRLHPVLHGSYSSRDIRVLSRSNVAWCATDEVGVVMNHFAAVTNAFAVGLLLPGAAQHATLWFALFLNAAFCVANLWIVHQQLQRSKSHTPNGGTP